MSADRFRVQVGMEVVASDQRPVGRVRELEPTTFLVERPNRPDALIPYSAIAGMEGNRVRLGIKESQVDEEGWAASPTAAASGPIGRLEVQPGMEVVGSDERHIGKVIGVGQDEFTMDRDVGLSLYHVPRSAIKNVANHQVVLNVPSGDIDAMGWTVEPSSWSERGYSIRQGMEVLGFGGNKLGAVSAIYPDYFVVGRSLSSDLFIPYQAIKHVANDRITLTMRAEQITNQRWERPPSSPAQPSRTGGALPISRGMAVVGADGDRVGTVTKVNETDFVVQRRADPTIHVPFQSVQEVTESQVVLTVPNEQIEMMNWDLPTE